MHPWMLEKMAQEHRRDLLALACRTRPDRRPTPTWRSRLSRSVRP